MTAEDRSRYSRGCERGENSGGGCIRVATAYWLILHRISPLVYSSYYGGGGSIVSARIYSGPVRWLGYEGRWATQREGQEMPSNGAKTAEVGAGMVCSWNGKPVRRTSGTSSPGNPAYLLHGTGKHVGMKEVWLPFRKTRHTEAE